MNTVTTIARLLLGAVFTLAGAFPFFVTAPAPLPGLAGTFNQVFYHSHWALFLGAAQVTIGVLLLANRFVPLALVMLAAFLYNSFAFHITMMPSGLPGPIIVLLLAYPIARRHWPVLAPLFRSNREAPSTPPVHAG